MARVARVSGWATLLAAAPAPAAALNLHGGRHASQDFRDCIEEYAQGIDEAMGTGKEWQKTHWEPPFGSWLRRRPLEAQATSDREVIFGAGSGSTGTKSVSAALRSLGLFGWHAPAKQPWHWQQTQVFLNGGHDCHTQLAALNYTALPEAVEFYMDDWCVGNFLNYYLSFPKAKFILTNVTNTTEWAEKRVAEFPDYALLPVVEPCMFPRMKDHSIERSVQLEEATNKFVECVVPPERLMVINLFSDPPERISGLMQELATFVGRPLKDPNQPFPSLDVTLNKKDNKLPDEKDIEEGQR